MASTYTGLGTELMTTGENAGDWGTKTNTNLKIIEQFAGGYIEQAVTTTTTLSVSDGSVDATLAHRIIKFTGTLSANATVTIPLDVQNLYILKNGTAGAYTLTFKYVSGSGSTVVFAATDKGTKIVYATADHGTNPNMVDTGISTNTITGATGDITIDSPADIILDAEGADISLKDGGTLFGTLTNSSGELVIKSSSSGTTAATFSGANVTLAGTVGSGNITSTGTVQGTTITATTAFVPDASDGAALGTSALEFSDLFLADGAVINFGDDQDITLTHSADTGLTTNGTFQATTITATAAFVPDASDGAALGTTSLEFSDLFLADGAVVNFGDDQEVTLTHVADAGLLLNSSNYLTFRDSALKISSSADGQLDIDADTEVEITATTVDLNGILDVSGVIVAGGQISAADGSASAPSISNTGDLNTGFLFSAADTMQFSSGGTAQVTFQDGAIVPVTDDDIDLGTASLQFKDVYVDGTLEADAITIGGSAVVSSPITALNNATANELVTVGATTTELEAEANLTFDGTTLTATALTVDDVAVNGKVVTMTGSTSDTAVFTAGTHGTLSIVTTDDAAAAANIQITADGTVDIDSAGVLTLDSGAAINIEPASGSAILLDGTISIDAGVVTGATSITSTAFVGDITGDVTGNTSGTAATVTTAAQTNITSLGTLTALTVDDVAINGKVVTMTGSTSDTAVLTAGTHGTLSIVTTDDAAAAANITVTADGTFEADGTTVTLDSAGDVVLDAGGADVFLKDDGTLFGTLTNSGGELVIKSSSSGTTALTFSGANATLAGDLTISGDDLTMATNTSGAALIADGTNFNPVVISGDISIATNGAASIAANSVDGTHIALGSDAAGDVMYYNGTNYIRLAKGDDDQVLTLASGVPSWASAGGIGMGKAIAAALVFG